MPSIPLALRRQVIELAGGRCEYCRLPESYSSSSFAVDHIHPRSRAGENETENLAFSCQGCNGSKYNKVEATDPATGATVPLFHPRKQRWSDHFTWSEDTLIVVGTTATGRATVTALNLNRQGVVNLRELLRSRGFHPPTDD